MQLSEIMKLTDLVKLGEHCTDDDVRVRRMAVSNPRMPVEYLAYMSMDEDWDVKRKVLSHTNTPPEIRFAMISAASPARVGEHYLTDILRYDLLPSDDAVIEVLKETFGTKSVDSFQLAAAINAFCSGVATPSEKVINVALDLIASRGGVSSVAFFELALTPSQARKVYMMSPPTPYLLVELVNNQPIVDVDFMELLLKTPPPPNMPIPHGWESAHKKLVSLLQGTEKYGDFPSEWLEEIFIEA